MPTPKKPQDHKKKQPNYGAGWKSRFHDLTLPSGEVCQVVRPGVQGLIKAGVLQSLDALTAIVQTETIPKAEGKPVVDIKAITGDSDKFNSMMEAVDKIVIHVVQQPKVYDLTITQHDIDKDDLPFTAEDLGREFTDEDPRDPDRIYIDYIDSMDKMFIMNFAVGGSADLAQFRQATTNVVGSVSDGQGA